MKKALQISIAKTLFTIEDDAYAVLDGYIASVKEHFGATIGKDEIIADIESRIAEQLLENKEQVISIGTVEKVISVMGRVEDFDDKENISDVDAMHAGADEHSGNSDTSSQNKKLYRNPDNQYIGGVASGIAEYFGIEAMWTRLAFVILTLINGFGILIYIVLWIVLPEAKTKSQKLEMKGTPVTLNTLSSTVNERINKMDTNGSLRRIIALPFKLIGKILRFIARVIGPIFRIGTGIAFTLFGIGALVGIMVFCGFIISDSVLLTYDATLSSLLPNGLHWIAIAGFALAALVPALAVLISGISLLQKRSIFTRNLTFGFLGLWLIALLASGFSVAKIVSNLERIESTSPAHQIMHSEILLTSSFNKLLLNDGVRVTVVQGTSTSLMISGTNRAIQSVQADVQNNTLNIERKRIVDSNGANERFCLFCSTQISEIVLTIPSLPEVILEDGSDLVSDNFPASNSLSLSAERGSYVNIFLNTKNLNASSTHGSQIYVKGKAETTNLYAVHGSRILGEEFKVQNATTSAAHGSRIEIDATQTLGAKAIYGSRVRYGSSPVVTEDATDGSLVESADEY